MSELLYSKQVKAEAQRLGFAACGLAPAEALPDDIAEQYRQWLRNGNQANMAYLENNLEKRLDPRLLVEGAKTVISVAMNYYTEDELSPRGYAFARYARGRDYHDIMRERLRMLMAALGIEEHVDGRPFCDTAPVDERYWAMRCGLGWRGRSGQLIIPHAGTYFFLGEVIVCREADIYDHVMASHCGSCHRCLDACPTGALLGNGMLDARRCLSYLTIEHRGDFPKDVGEDMGQCVYGCDRCAEACPWNRFAKETAETEFRPSEALKKMTADDWQNLTVEQYRMLFKGSAVKRAKFEGLRRNIDALHKAKKDNS